MARQAQARFEAWALGLAVWAGAFLLAQDLGRGALRPIAVLPLKAREIGRGCWLATVPIPAAGLAALLFLGSFAFCRLHPDHLFPVGRLAMVALFSLVWLGMEFNVFAWPLLGLGGKTREATGSPFTGCLSLLALPGTWLLCLGASASLPKAAIILGVGGLLTVAGWYGAEHFEPAGAWAWWLGRPNLDTQERPGPPGVGLMPLGPKTPPGQFRPPAGYGGLPYLLTAAWIPVSLLGIFPFLTAALVVAFVALLALWSHMGLVAFAVLSSYGSLVVIPTLLQEALAELRLLRTLPLSTISLAAMLISLVLVPLIATGAAAAGVAGLVLGTPAALTLLRFYTLVLAPASVCVFLGAWSARPNLTNFLVAVATFGLGWLVVMKVPWLPETVPLGLLCLGVAATVLFALLLTYVTLLRSNSPYRARGSSFGAVP